MRKLCFWRPWVLTALLIMGALVYPSAIQAANFTQATIRPSRIKTNTSPAPILILAKTSQSATEDTLRLTAGPAWNISGTASNYTVSTAGLPSGVSAWPGISTATGVSGQVITFPSGNLSAGTLYGFYLTGGITNNPAAGTGGNYVWNLTTLSGGSSVDSSDVSLPVVADDSIVITGTVPTTAAYFNQELIGGTQASYAQDEEIEFTVEYSSTYASTTDLQLQVEWDLGIITDTSQPASVLEYVIGSASDGYGSAAPVVNTTNRTITWDIEDFPANETATVTFKLQTTDNYSGDSAVTADIRAQILEPAVTTASEVTITYNYDAPPSSPNPTATPSPTATPTATGTPLPSATPTPEPQTPVAVNSVNVRTLSPTQAGVEIILTQPAPLVVIYGETSQLGQRLVLPQAAVRHIVEFPNLGPSTTYFFKIAVGADGTPTNEFFSFTTTDQIKPELLQTNSLVIGQHIPLLSLATTTGSTPYIVVADSRPQPVLLSFTEPDMIQEVYLEIRKQTNRKEISSSALLAASTYQVSLVKNQFGEFSGYIELPDLFGWYEVFAVVEDIHGNIDEHLLAYPQFTSPLTVVNKNTNKPIEHALVRLWRYDDKSRLFVEITAAQLGKSELVTDSAGQLSLTLPFGRYQVEASSPRHQVTTSEFTLSETTETKLPTLMLNPVISAVAYGRYYWVSTNRFSRSFWENVTVLSRSPTIFEMAALSTLLICSVLVLWSFEKRSNVGLIHLPLSVWHQFKNTVTPQPNNFQRTHIRGKITANSQPLKATITFFDAAGEVLVQTTSNNSGFFNLVARRHPLTYEASAPGFVVNTGMVPIQTTTFTTLHIELGPPDTLAQKTVHQTKVLGGEILGMAFEVLLLLSVLLQLSFASSLGWQKVAPFMVLSIINILMWLRSRSP